MKNLCGIILLFLCLGGHAQTTASDSLTAAPVPPDVDSSAIGKPIGDAVTKTIGPEGGKISSADGLMELSFPPGALAAPTSIGIQLIENTSVMNFGKTYACTPDGIHFQKPVEMIIHYADSMAKGITASIPVIRWQDKNGRWSSVARITLDSVTHTLTGRVEHFSNYSAATTFKIIPRHSSIKVGQQHTFVLAVSGAYPDGKQYSSDASFWKEHTVEWSVDGTLGGTATSGRITPIGAYEMNGAIYTAPTVIPAMPVEIKAKYFGKISMGPGSFVENVISLATTDIYDEFHFSFTGYDRMGHLEMIDSSSCDIRAYSSGNVDLYNIQNYPPWSDWPSHIGQCSYDYPDKTGWKGLIQIAGMSSGLFTRRPATSPGTPASARILIVLTPATGSTPRYTAHCKGGTRNVPSYPMQAFPASINLELMPTQDIRVTYGSASGLNTYGEIRNGQGFSMSASRLP